MGRMDDLSQIMGLQGWEVLKEFLTNQLNSDLVALASPKRQYPDDFYRGRVDVIQWFLKALPEQVAEHFRAIAEKEAGPTLAEDLGHPYADEDGQPVLEGEDLK
jgi:hypothetical protein